MKRKKAIAVQALAGYGKCSLTVALPILSAMGVETSVLPTALMSTHSSPKMGDFTFHSLTEDMAEIIGHYEKLGLSFDAVYSGYLAEEKQIDSVKRLLKMKNENGIFLFDPVMADNGRYYKGFGDEYCKRVRELAALSDITVPNVTEACLLAGVDYINPPYTREFVDGLLYNLSDLGAKCVIITSVESARGEYGCAMLEKGKSPEYILLSKINGNFHGTGDLFASVLLGKIMNGSQIGDAVPFACRFVEKCINASDKECESGGLLFEKEIPFLLGDE